MVNYKMKMCKDIARELGLKPEDVRYSYDLIFDHIKMLVNSGEQVVVKHFGSFKSDGKGGVEFKKSSGWVL